MRKLHDPIKIYLAKKIQTELAEAPFEMSAIYDQLVDPPNPDMGDLAFGCFIIAKALKKAPPQIATALAAKLNSEPEKYSATAAGPYLNFSLKPQFVGENFLSQVLSGELFKTQLTENAPKTMIEFSQPNTHKELHVGHMRNACLGDSLVRLHRYAGFEMISSTFPGDVGTHVAKCLWYLKYHNTQPIPEMNKGEWLGKIYSAANAKLEDEVGTPKEDVNRTQLTEILKQIELKSGEFFDLWKETRQWSIDLMQSVYKWAGITFDQWYWESDVDSDSVKFVKELFAEGKLEKSEGAIGMNLEDEKLGFCLLLKSDGNGLYATKDLELARKKFQDFKIQKNIYVVDMRQALHFKQVFKVLERLGFEQAKDCFHLQYNFVELPDGAMSSRKGNIVPLMELVHRMEEMVKANYLSRYKDEWSSDEIELTAQQVAKGAIKYGMLRMDTNKKIVFDMNEWLKIEGESGPFVQYSSSRINSIIKKVGELDPAKSKSIKWEVLAHDAERKLIQSLMQFQGQVLSSTLNYRPAQLCTYLYELAKRFNFFYHECSIAQAESEDLKNARLALSQVTRSILQKGLELLGIPAPNRM